MFKPTIETIKEEVASYDMQAGKIYLTDEQAQAVLESYEESLQQYFCDYIRDFIMDGELNELIGDEEE